MILKLNEEEYIKLFVANNFFKRLMGLMFKKNIDYALFFKRTNSIHTFFMKENIDIIGVDNHGIIIYKAMNIPKNKVIIIKESIKKTNIIEMPAFKSKDLPLYEKLTFIRK